MKNIVPVALFVCFAPFIMCAQRVEVPVDNPNPSTATVWLVTVRGLIADPTSAALPNATLVLQKRNHDGFQDVQSIKSDQTGRFDFGDKPAGIYRLIASAHGFCRINIPVEISGKGWAISRLFFRWVQLILLPKTAPAKRNLKS